MNIKHTLLVLPLLLVSSLVTAVQTVDAPLALRLTHDTQSLGGDGVYRTEHFQEQFIRQNDTIWVARILPKGAHDAHEHADQGAEHKHLDVNAAARLISKDPKGNLNVRLVEFNDKAVVNIAKTEYDAAGFDGNWSTAYYLIDPVHLKTFKATNSPAPAGAHWYESKNPQSYVRVLWNEQKRYPLQVESGSLDGRLKRTLKAEPQAFPAKAPWQTISNFKVKEYSDFLD
jgi:hypothetical protein